MDATAGVRCTKRSVYAVSYVFCSCMTILICYSAVFIGKVMDGKSLYGATKQAMQVVSNMIEMNYENVDKYKGIPLETCLEVIK